MNTEAGGPRDLRLPAEVVARHYAVTLEPGMGSSGSDLHFSGRAAVTVSLACRMCCSLQLYPRWKSWNLQT